MENKIKVIKGKTLTDLRPYLKQINILTDTNYCEDVIDEWVNENPVDFSVLMSESGTGYLDVLLQKIGKINFKEEPQVNAALGVITRWLQYLDPNLSVQYKQGDMVIKWYSGDKRIQPSAGIKQLTYYLGQLYVRSVLRKGWGNIPIFLWDCPEGLLHAQTRYHLGIAITRIAQEYPYIRLVIRTSDNNLFYGIRMGVKDAIVPADQVSFFYSEDENTTLIPIDPSGQFSVWPTGFFDTLDGVYLEFI